MDQKLKLGQNVVVYLLFITTSMESIMIIHSQWHS